MYNVIIVGVGKIYSEHLNLIKYQELKGEINVVAITGNENINSTLDGYKFLSKQEAFALDFDYCLIAINDYSSVIEEAISFGIERAKLIPIRVFAIPYFSFSSYIDLKLSNLSIISCNCFGGFVSNYLALEFLSPTINLYFKPNEFIKFAQNLTYYLEQPVVFVESQYEKNLKYFYPVCKIGDIYIYILYTIQVLKKLWMLGKEGNAK